MPRTDCRSGEATRPETLCSGDAGKGSEVQVRLYSKAGHSSFTQNTVGHEKTLP